MSAFKGFPVPKQNYSKLPHTFIDLLPSIDSMSELKVLIYILRHTWGFSEFDKLKKITTDEFMNGRKHNDGTRMDSGTGLSNNSVISGLISAVEHGYINVEVDDKDQARIKKYYTLNMDFSYADVAQPASTIEEPASESAQRSEKETIGKKPFDSDIRFSKIQNYLENAGILLTSDDTRLLDIWIELHEDEWITKAIELTRAKGVRNCKYTNTILAGWHENGYPEKRNGAKNGDNSGNSGYGKNGGSNRGGRTPANGQGESRPSHPTGLSASDQAVADRINARRQARRAGEKANV